VDLSEWARRDPWRAALLGPLTADSSAVGSAQAEAGAREAAAEATLAAGAAPQPFTPLHSQRCHRHLLITAADGDDDDARGGARAAAARAAHAAPGSAGLAELPAWLAQPPLHMRALPAAVAASCARACGMPAAATRAFAFAPAGSASNDTQAPTLAPLHPTGVEQAGAEQPEPQPQLLLHALGPRAAEVVLIADCVSILDGMQAGLTAMLARCAPPPPLSSPVSHHGGSAPPPICTAARSGGGTGWQVAESGVHARALGGVGDALDALVALVEGSLGEVAGALQAAQGSLGEADSWALTGGDGAPAACADDRMLRLHMLLGAQLLQRQATVQL
jgi:hypothetical protein